MVFSGRPERARELRDAVHLLRPGDLPVPAGETCLAWRRAVERPISITALGRALSAFEPDWIARWLDAGQGSAVTRAAMLPESVLREAPRADVAGLNLADAALAQALAMFLSCDAVAPSALPLPDRAARRLCDRLVDLGAVRELIGRGTFRLSGV